MMSIDYTAFSSLKTCATSHPSFCFCRIDRVLFNDPATIVFWIDTNGFDHKTVVKCCEHDVFDSEKGLAMALCKIMLGDDFHKTFKDWVEIDGNK